MRPYQRLLVMLVLALGLACGGGSEPTKPTAPQAPSAFQVVNPSDTSLGLTWVDTTQPPPAGYALQARLAGGTFEALHTGLLPADTRGVLLTFSSIIPELTAFEFRLRSERSGLPSDWVQANYQYPMLPVGNVIALQIRGAETVQVQWTVTSQVATATDILRRDASVADSPWDLLSRIDPATTQFLDTTAQEGRSYQYAIQQSGPAGASTPRMTSNTLLLPCRVPINLSGTWNGSSLDLTWTPTSATANRQLVYRITESGTYSLIATLDGTARSYQDPTPPAEMTWYWVEAASPAMTWPVRSAKILIPPKKLGGWLVTPLAIEDPNVVLRAPDGTWWIEHGQTASGGGTLRAFGAAQELTLSLGDFRSNRILLDHTGTPQGFGRVLTRSPGLVHAWLERGVLATQSLDNLLPEGLHLDLGAFLMAPDSSLHLIGQEPHPYLSPSPLQRLNQTPGGWTRETLPSPWNPDWLSGAAYDAQGNLLLGLSRSGDATTKIGWWKADGSYGMDDLPALSLLRHIVPTPWGETFLLGEWIKPDDTREARALRGNPGLWQGPEVPSAALGRYPLYGTWAVDALRQRLCGLGETADGRETVLLIRQGDTWTIHPLGILADQAWSGANPQGKFWLAVKPRTIHSGPRPILIIEEP